MRLDERVADGCVAQGAAGQRLAVELVPTAESRAFRPEAMALRSGVRGRASDRHRQAGRPRRASRPRATGRARCSTACWRGTPRRATLPRAGIVHRLDKDTSGLMVVGKTLAGRDRAVARDRGARGASRSTSRSRTASWPCRADAHRRADRPRPALARAHGGASRRASRRRTDVERVGWRRAWTRDVRQCAALHAAHRPHAPDPRPPGVAWPSAGGRRAVRRASRARPGSARRCTRRRLAFAHPRHRQGAGVSRPLPPEISPHAWRAGRREAALERSRFGTMRAKSFRGAVRAGRREVRMSRRSARPPASDRVAGKGATEAVRACSGAEPSPDSGSCTAAGGLLRRSGLRDTARGPEPPQGRPPRSEPAPPAEDE